MDYLVYPTGNGIVFPTALSYIIPPEKFKNNQ